eukprot:scaffold116767_cov57-Attheya_sp.AAC.6
MHGIQYSDLKPRCSKSFKCSEGERKVSNMNCHLPKYGTSIDTLKQEKYVIACIARRRRRRKG